MLTRMLSRPRVFVGLAVLLSALTAAKPSWANEIGVDVWNLPTLEQDEREAIDLTSELTATDHEVQQRIVIKESKIGELIAGRLTLAEVTDEFLTMNQMKPGFMSCIRAQYAGRTDREKMAHNVIDYARGRLEHDGNDASILSHLDAELDEMTAADPQLDQ